MPSLRSHSVRRNEIDKQQEDHSEGSGQNHRREGSQTKIGHQVAQCIVPLQTHGQHDGSADEEKELIPEHGRGVVTHDGGITLGAVIHKRLVETSGIRRIHFFQKSLCIARSGMLRNTKNTGCLFVGKGARRIVFTANGMRISGFPTQRGSISLDLVGTEEKGAQHTSNFHDDEDSLMLGCFLCDILAFLTWLVQFSFFQLFVSPIVPI
mmetsp:Transcript_6167/g.15225  ORF Transcript_6167/g.15225 Transcript_6167/m.15225 type:complete len:209 (+) Transcript_6167:8021-8647(+)